MKNDNVKRKGTVYIPTLSKKYDNVIENNKAS